VAQSIPLSRAIRLAQSRAERGETRANFRPIYRVNSAAIGSNPAIIEASVRLDIPCLDGAVAALAAGNSPIRTEATTERLPVQEKRQIRFATPTDRAPCSNQDHEQGDMITEIVNVSTQKVTEDGDDKIDWIKD